MPQFSKLDEVQPPRYHVGQTVQILSSGKRVPATVKRVQFWGTKQGRKTVYEWDYALTVSSEGREVSVCLREDNILGEMPAAPALGFPSVDQLEVVAGRAARGLPAALTEGAAGPYRCADCHAPNAGTRCAVCGCEQFTWTGDSPPLRKEAPDALPTLKLQAERNVTVNRNERATLSLRFVPTALYQAASEEEQREARAALANLTPSDLSMHLDGTIGFYSASLAQWFTIEDNGGEWEYAGGDVATVGEPRYCSRLSAA